MIGEQLRDAIPTPNGPIDPQYIPVLILSMMIFSITGTILAVDIMIILSKKI